MTKTWKLDKADSTEQHFWTDAAGAHISSTGDHDTSGFHQLLTSVKNAFMHGTTELMTISADLIELGKNSVQSLISLCGGTGKIGVIDGILVMFSEQIGIKGNSKSYIISNGSSSVSAINEGTTYTGVAQVSDHAPTSDSDHAYSLMQAICTKNSDSSTVSESYINLAANPDGTAPATVKASEIAMNSSATTNPYVRVKADSPIEISCPNTNNGSVHIGAYDASTGTPIDSGIAYIPHYGTADTSAACLNVQQIQTPSKLVPINTFEALFSQSIYQGSLTINNVSGNYLLPWGLQTIQELFPNLQSDYPFIGFTNGDYDVNPFLVIGASIQQNRPICFFNQSVSAEIIRLNYVVIG